MELEEADPTSGMIQQGVKYVILHPYIVFHQK